MAKRFVGPPKTELLYKSDGSVVNLADLLANGGGGGGGTDPTPPANVTLQNNATANGNGTPFTVGSYKTLTVEVTGTSASRTVVFEAQSTSGAWYPIQGVKLQDFSMATQTTGNGEVWQFDITGLAAFRARVSAIAGGNVSVRGKAVT